MSLDIKVPTVGTENSFLEEKKYRNSSRNCLGHGVLLQLQKNMTHGQNFLLKHKQKQQQQAHCSNQNLSQAHCSEPHTYPKLSLTDPNF